MCTSCNHDHGSGPFIPMPLGTFLSSPGMIEKVNHWYKCRGICAKSMEGSAQHAQSSLTKFLHVQSSGKERPHASNNRLMCCNHKTHMINEKGRFGSRLQFQPKCVRIC